jgi:hypothetical protein
VEFAGQYFEQYFQVAAYRPPEFEVTVEPEAPEVLRGDDVNAPSKPATSLGGRWPEPTCVERAGRKLPL